MIKIKKLGSALVMAGILTAASAITSFAAWNLFPEGYMKGFTEIDGDKYYVMAKEIPVRSTWRWIDADGDGTCECYYFDGDGRLLVSTNTPDGYQVNADGAWTVNGQVQTKARTEAVNSADQSGIIKFTPMVSKVMEAGTCQELMAAYPDLRMKCSGWPMLKDGQMYCDFRIRGAELGFDVIWPLTLNMQSGGDGIYTYDQAAALGAVTDSGIHAISGNADQIFTGWNKGVYSLSELKSMLEKAGAVFDYTSSTNAGNMQINGETLKHSANFDYRFKLGGYCCELSGSGLRSLDRIPVDILTAVITKDKYAYELHLGII